MKLENNFTVDERGNILLRLTREELVQICKEDSLKVTFEITLDAKAIKRIPTYCEYVYVVVNGNEAFTLPWTIECHETI